ncbi:MAG: ABC transporter substrate-binding protein, partial [Bacilli bacterium]
CGDNGAGTIKGNTQYWNASADGENDEAFESMVGVKADSTDNSLTITLNAPVNQFYAMYYLASSLTEPICKDFLDEVGIDNYGKNDTTKGTTPVDNILALGAYMLEEWEADKKIVFKKNDKWIEATHPEYEDTANLHNIKGVHIAILTGAATDKELAFKEFLDGKLDACSIPSTQLASYVDDPRTTTTKGDSVFKLNMNSCDQSTWNELFGVNGSITQTAESDYWQCKPLMSNDNFLNGLDCAINREEFATSVGSIPSQNYFSTNYMSDPENGISYDTTEQHAAVLADRFPETYGYNYDAAQQLFSKAIDEEIAAGTITAGTATSPTVQYIDVWWMYEYMTTEYASIGQYIEKAFNSVGIDKGVKLVVRNSAVSVWSDVYYKHLMVGQFDLGFGSISGNSLNPINFMEVLRSDNSSGFTLNWGTDTSVVSDEINYDGMNWSYNALWQAADTGVIVDSDGNQVVAHKFGTPEVKSFNDDGSVTVTVALELAVAAGATIKLETAYFYYASIAANDYVSVDVEWSYVDNVLTYIIPKSVIDDDMKYYCEFDIIYSITIDGVTTEINKWVEPDDYGFLHQ